MISPLRALQPLGRALMLPIAVLPAAGLLLRLGQPDLLDIAFVSAAGEAIFTHLGLLFAIGVATGFARDGNGAACMAGVVCFLIATLGAQSLMAVPAEAAAGLSGDAAKLAIAAWKAKAIARLDVPIGIASGLIGGLFYNRFSTVTLPDYLAFFGGRRFVPIVSGLAGLGIALIVGPGFAVLNGGIDQLSWGVVQAGPVGLFLFGLLNRLLLVTGLHHLLNNIAWFVVGDWHGTTGDLRRFFAGDPQAGVFMTGFFPVMMFGLPAACLAMYHAARPDRRKAVGGMLLSLALTSALTGVTEPIEFSFMFLAPLLYAIHAVLTGLSMALTQMLGMKLGFGFSAGLFDYVLNYGKATRPLLLLPFGLAYGALYYGLFRFFIARFDLATPGREPAAEASATPPATISGSRGDRFVAALGGRDNLVEVGACTTRLRLGVRDDARIDDAALKALGARGLIRPTRGQVQVVLGPIADQVAVEMRDAMAAPASAPVAEPSSGFAGLPGVVAVSEHPGRVRLTLADGASLTDADLIAAGARAVARPAPGIVHVITG